MGACESKVFPRELTYNELVGLPLGEHKNAPGCVPNIEGIQPGSGYDHARASGFTFPQNGEFEWALTGPCDMDPDTFGCEYAPQTDPLGNTRVPSSRGPTAGARIGVRRIAYNGDNYNCCISGGLTDGTGRTCSPGQITGKSASCDAPFSTFCTSGGNILLDRCADWRDKNPEKTLATMTRYCSANPFSRECVAWGANNNAVYDSIIGAYCTADKMGDVNCRNACLARPGGCNAASVEYCTGANADAKYCSCLNIAKYISADSRKMGYWPKCYSGDCLAYGYKSESEDSAICPDIVNCSIVQNLTAGGDITLADVNIIQNCSLESGKKDTDPETAPTQSEPINITIPAGTINGTTTDTNNESMKIYIVLLFILIILFSLSVTYYFNDKYFDLLKKN